MISFYCQITQKVCLISCWVSYIPTWFPLNDIGPILHVCCRFVQMNTQHLRIIMGCVVVHTMFFWPWKTKTHVRTQYNTLQPQLHIPTNTSHNNSFIHHTIHSTPFIHRTIHSHYSSVHSIITPLIHHTIHSFITLFIHSSHYSFIHHTIHSLITPFISHPINSSHHSLIHSFTHSLIQHTKHIKDI